MTYFPLHPILTPVNRRERRKYEHEAEHILDHLDQLEEQFVTLIFTETITSVSYNDAYSHYLEMWNNRIEWMTITNKFKVTRPNRDYFRLVYGPIETN